MLKTLLSKVNQTLMNIDTKYNNPNKNKQAIITCLFYYLKNPTTLSCPVIT